MDSVDLVIRISPLGFALIKIRERACDKNRDIKKEPLKVIWDNIMKERMDTRIVNER
jgi:hypothetical protein